MLFILIATIFIIIFSFKDISKEELEKDKKKWEEITKAEYK